MATGGEKPPDTVQEGKLGRWRSWCIPVVWFVHVPADLFLRL